MVIQRSSFDIVHRKDKGLPIRLLKWCFSFSKVEYHETRIKLKIQGQVIARLTITESGKLFGIAK